MNNPWNTAWKGSGGKGKKLRPATDATGKPIPTVKNVATTEDNNVAQTPEAE